MEKINLEASLREGTGKSAARHVRQQGQVPAVVYKDGEVGLSVRVGLKDLMRALHTEAGANAIITLDISDGTKVDSRTVIVKETQVDPLTDALIHADFHEISLLEKITVDVPITVKGEAIGVAEEDGVFTQAMWELEVECLPTDIPEHIDVNVEELRIGDAIHVKDLTVPEGVTVLSDDDQVVASVHVQEAEEEPEEIEEGEGEEPEVIKKGKEEEEESEKPEEE